jgi:hypothetical protein
LVPENTVALASSDLAHTVGFERGEVVVDGGSQRPMTLRGTHIDRRVGDARRLVWLVYHHADFPPDDHQQTAR